MHQISRWFALVAIALSATSADAASSEVVVISSVEAPPIQTQYDQVDALSNGPVMQGQSATSGHGRFMRFVLLRPFQNPPEFRMELWTNGTEGCCQRLVQARQFDVFTSEFLNTFGGAFVSGCESNVSFDRWLSPTSFSFFASCRRFIAERVQQNSMSIHADNPG